MAHVSVKTAPSLAALAVVGIVACSSAEDPDTLPESGGAGSAGRAAGAEGTAGAATSGTGGTTAAGSGGAGTLGASAPTAGTAGETMDPPWDMTLGGFNQDLPPPSMPCEIGLLRVGACMAISGVYNDEPFDGQGGCIIAYGHLDGGYRGATLEYDLAPGDTLDVGTKVGRATAPDAPSTFAAPGPLVPPGDTYAMVFRDSRMFGSHMGDDEPIATHDVESRIAGELWYAQPDAQREEQVLAYFAVSVIPKPGCVPDADGLGCDSVRLRGMVVGQTLKQ